MDFNFQKFERTNSKYEDRITITKRKSFGFPTRFYNDNHIEEYKYAVLYFDKENKAIGINFTNSQEEKHKFTIIKSKKGFGGSIIATSFFKSYTIDSEKYYGRYKWEIKQYPNIEKLFVIVLKERSDFEFKASPENNNDIDGGVAER
jgi:hypothetical protein